MSHRRLVTLVAGVGVVGLTLAGLFIALSFAAPIPDAWGFRGFGFINALGFTTIGVIVVSRRPASVIGWLLLADGLVWCATELAGEYSIYAVVGRAAPLPAGLFAAWLSSWTWTISVGVYPILLALFPDGRLSDRIRRAIVTVAVVAMVLLALEFAVRPGPLQLASFVDNPFTPLPQVAVDLIGTLSLVLTFPVGIAAVGRIVQRFRTSSVIERQQIKWLAFAALPLLLLGPLSSVVPGKPIQVLSELSQLAVPAAIAIAVLRYRLYDIDVLINRALVYGATTAGIAVAFFTGIVVLQALLRPFTSGSELAVAASTLASLALFQPLRRRMQDTVDRRFYRSRYDAGRTLDAFSERLRDEVDLESVRAELVAAVRDTVQPAHAGIWLREGAR